MANNMNQSGRQAGMKMPAMPATGRGPTGNSSKSVGTSFPAAPDAACKAGADGVKNNKR